MVRALHEVVGHNVTELFVTFAPSKRCLFLLTRFVIRAWLLSTVQIRAWALARVVRRGVRHGARAKRRCCVQRLRATALVRGVAAKARKRRCKARVQSSSAKLEPDAFRERRCCMEKALSIAALPPAIWYIRFERQRRCRLLCCITCFKTPQAHRIHTYRNSEFQTCFQRYDYVGE